MWTMEELLPLSADLAHRLRSYARLMDAGEMLEAMALVDDLNEAAEELAGDCDHRETWQHPGPDRPYGRALETCYRCGLTKYLDEPWPGGTQ